MSVELDVTSEQLKDVRFGRNKLFAILGGALTATAVRMFGTPEEAAGGPGPILYPYGCFGSACSSCSGFRCTATNCKPAVDGCTSVTSCWFACNEVNRHLYICCEWTTSTLPLAPSCLCQQILVRNGCNPA